jgi:hypothetical protein
MQREPVDSAMLKSIGYEDGVLEVEFKKNSKVYRYRSDSLTNAEMQDLYDGFLAAESKGTYFAQVVRHNVDLIQA